tara:strand:- start:164 stop:403 length:240 start_codon:yes stop_codon:yes gene_type:complete
VQLLPTQATPALLYLILASLTAALVLQARQVLLVLLALKDLLAQLALKDLRATLVPSVVQRLSICSALPPVMLILEPAS